MTAPSAVRRAKPADRAGATGGAWRGPSWPVRVVMAVLTGLLLAAGAWGVLASRGAGLDVGHAAQVGDAVQVPGGLLRVDAVRNLDPGHNMAGMNPDPVPAGFRRISVDVTVRGADPGGLRFAAADFTLAGDGMKPVKTRQHNLGNAFAPAGSTLSGNLAFEYPGTARNLVLRFRGAGRAIALEAPAGPVHTHS